MIECNPKENFIKSMKSMTDVIDIGSKHYYKMYSEYLESHNKQMLEALIKTHDVYCNELRCEVCDINHHGENCLVDIIESVIGKKI